MLGSAERFDVWNAHKPAVSSPRPRRRDAPSLITVTTQHRVGERGGRVPSGGRLPFSAVSSHSVNDGVTHQVLNWLMGNHSTALQTDSSTQTSSLCFSLTVCVFTSRVCDVTGTRLIFAMATGTKGMWTEPPDPPGVLADGGLWGPSAQGGVTSSSVSFIHPRPPAGTPRYTPPPPPCLPPPH